VHFLRNADTFEASFHGQVFIMLQLTTIETPEPPERRSIPPSDCSPSRQMLYFFHQTNPFESSGFSLPCLLL
jgi:hypothetical protein